MVHLRCTVLAGILILAAGLVVISDDMGAVAEDIGTWENVSNITYLSQVHDIQVNSNRDSVFILMGNSVEQWGLEQPVRYGKYDRPWGEIYDLQWSDQLNRMAVLHAGSPGDFPSVWDSELVILDGNMDVIEALAPWGNLSYYTGADMVDIEWNPVSSQLAILHDDGVLRIIDTIGPTVLLERDLGPTATNLKWNPQGSLLACQLDAMVDTIMLLDPSQNTSWELSKVSVMMEYCWSRDGQLIYALRSSNVLEIPVATGISEEIWEGYAVGLASSPEEAIIAISETDAISFLYRSTGELSAFHQRRAPVGLSQWTLDGVYFVHLDESDIVHVWTRRSPPVLPWVSIVSPMDGSTVSGMLNISGTAWSTYDDNAYVAIKVGPSDWVMVNGFEEWHTVLDTRTIPDGRLTIRAKAIDPNGPSSIAMVTVGVENGGPSTNERPGVRISSPGEGDEVWGVVRIWGTASDDAAVLSVQIKVGASHWVDLDLVDYDKSVNWNYYIDLYVEIDDVEIMVRSFDGSLFSETVSVTVDVVDVDNVAINMEVRILFPSNGMEVPSALNIMGIVLDGHPEVVLVKVGSGSIQAANGTDTWSFPLSGLINGAHSVSAIALNGTHQSTWTYITFYVREDHTPQNRRPMVGVTNPLNGSVVPDEFFLAGWSSDDVKVISLEVRIGNGEWMHAEGTGRWTESITVEEDFEGWLDIAIRAYDGEQYSDILSVRYYHASEGLSEPQTTFIAFYIVIVVLLIIIILLSAYIRRETQIRTE